MNKTTPPTFRQIMGFFRPFHGALRQAGEKGAAEVRSYFERRKRPIDRNLAPDLFRYGAKIYLDGAGHKAVESEYERLHQARNGLLIRCGTLNVRMLKLPDDGEAPAPRSGPRQGFYRQEEMLPFPEEHTGTLHANLLLLWDVDQGYNLTDLYLALPRGGDEREADLYWMRKLALPFTTVETTQEEPVEDLPITPKKFEKTADTPEDE